VLAANKDLMETGKIFLCTSGHSSEIKYAPANLNESAACIYLNVNDR